MDKFEQFGAVMLPPGEAFRHNHIALNKALMGMEMQGVNDQMRYDTAKYHYDNEQLERKRDFAIEQNVIKRDELKTKVDRENAMGLEKADHALASYNFQFDKQMEAFQKSEQLHHSGLALLQKNREQQLDYNRASFNLSKDSIENQTHERRQKLAFKTTQALLEHQKGKETGNLEYIQKLSGLEQKRTKAVMTQQAARAQAAQEGLVYRLKGTKAEGKARARGVQGRSYEKQIQAAVAESGIKQSMLYDKITRSGFAFDAAIYGIETAQRHTITGEGIRTKYADLAYALKEKQLDATDLSISKAYSQSKKGAELKWRGADKQAILKTDEGMKNLQARRMIQPVAGPIPPKWTDIAVPTVTDPLELEYGPAPVHGAYTSGTGTMGMGGGGQTTGGLITAGLGLAAVGATAAATTSGAAFLTSAGLGTIAAIAPWAAPVLAIAAIGSLFIDW